MLLSPRTIHFTKHQMYWHCKELAISQDYTLVTRGMLGTPSNPYGPDIDLSPDVNSQHDFHDSWWRLVADYSSRSLTYQHDKLVALQGIATKLVFVYHDKYVSGMWRSMLPLDLLWNTSEHEPTRIRLAGVPTWSWASLTGEIYVPLSEPGDVCVAVIAATPTVLQLKGMIWRCTRRSLFRYDIGVSARRQHLQACLSETTAGQYASVAMLSDVLSYDELESRPLYLFPVACEEYRGYHVSGLVLAADLACPNQFQRVGRFGTDLFPDTSPPRYFYRAPDNDMRMYIRAAQQAHPQVIELV